MTIRDKIYSDKYFIGGGNNDVIGNFVYLSRDEAGIHFGCGIELFDDIFCK